MMVSGNRMGAVEVAKSGGFSTHFEENMDRIY